MDQPVDLTLDWDTMEVLVMDSIVVQVMGSALDQGTMEVTAIMA